MDIKMNPVKSSQVESMGHCPKSNTMAIKFKSGGIYHYHDVSAEKFAAAQKAESIGKHLASNIKGVHKFSRIP